MRISFSAPIRANCTAPEGNCKTKAATEVGQRQRFRAVPLLQQESATEKQKTLRSIASGSLCVWVRAGYSAAGMASAALAALAAFFFPRLTLAQRFC